MHWINRYVDEPLLQGAAILLRAWHLYTGRRPDTLEPVCNVLAIAILLFASIYCLDGSILWLSQGALVMLALPSVLRLKTLGSRAVQYDARAYKALRATAAERREREWALRLAVLAGAAILPLSRPTDDIAATYFMLGACLWFALTAPPRFYLNAAEPPAPDAGDRFTRSAFGSAA